MDFAAKSETRERSDHVGWDYNKYERVKSYCKVHDHYKTTEEYLGSYVKLKAWWQLL